MTLQDKSVFMVRLKPQGKMVVVRTEWKPEKVNSIYLPEEYATNETLIRATVIATAPDCVRFKRGDKVYFTIMAAASEIESSANRRLMASGILEKGQTYVLHEDNIPLMYETITDADPMPHEADVIYATTSEAGRKREEEKLAMAKEGFEQMNNQRSGRIKLAGSMPGL